MKKNHHIKGEYYCWDTQAPEKKKHTVKKKKKTPLLFIVIAQQKSPRSRFHREKLLTKAHRVNCSPWLYCGTFLSCMRSILIRDVNYLCNSRQLICFVFSPLPSPPHPPATPTLSISKEAPYFHFFLPKGLINCTEQVYRAVFFSIVCFLLFFSPSFILSVTLVMLTGCPKPEWHSPQILTQSPEGPAK